MTWPYLTIKHDLTITHHHLTTQPLVEVPWCPRFQVAGAVPESRTMELLSQAKASKSTDQAPRRDFTSHGIDEFFERKICVGHLDHWRR